MLESTQVVDTELQPAEIPGSQSPTPPPQGPHQPSAVEKALDHLRQLFAKVALLAKSNPWIAWGAGIGLVVAIDFGAWYVHHSRTTMPTTTTLPPSRQAAKVVRPPAASHKPQGKLTNPPAAKVVKPQAASHKPQGKPTNPQAAKIAKLQSLARGAYKKANYALPVHTSAIAYSKQALALDPSNRDSRTLLEKSVSGGKSQVQQALQRKDFTKAHGVATAMTQVLPGRKDLVQLQQHVRLAEKTAAKPRHQPAVAKVSFTVYHMHSDKAPAAHGPYCLGILSVVGGHLKYSGQSASPGQQVHKLDFACSDVREIKKNAHVASHQGGFHVRTASAKMNFAPRDSSLAHVSALASACSE